MIGKMCACAVILCSVYWPHLHSFPYPSKYVHCTHCSFILSTATCNSEKDGDHCESTFYLALKDSGDADVLHMSSQEGFASMNESER